MSAGKTRGVGMSAHQRRCHAILRDAGYSWERMDGNAHNHYVNDYGQRYVTVGSPKNTDQGINRLRDTIRRQTRERQEQNVKQSQIEPSLADQLVAMADPFLLKQIDMSNRAAMLARAAAFDKWLKRSLEKHGPLYAVVLENAAERIGFPRSNVSSSRKRIGAVAYREKASWMVCFPYQLPANKQKRRTGKEVELGVQIEEKPPIESITHEQAAVIAGHAVIENGKPAAAIREQQAAFLMMAEAMGMKMPGDEARDALRQASAALDDAHAALSAAIEALS